MAVEPRLLTTGRVVGCDGRFFLDNGFLHIAFGLGPSANEFICKGRFGWIHHT